MNEGFLTAWLTFDEADNDPSRFLVHFQALLASVQWTGRAANGRSNRPRRPRLSLRLGDREASAVRQASRTFSRRFSGPGKPGNSEIFSRVPGPGSPSRESLHQLQIHPGDWSCASHRQRQLRCSATRGIALFPLGGRAVFCEDRTNHRHRRRSHLSSERGLARRIATVSLVRGGSAVRRLLGDFSSSRPRELVEYLADNVLAMQPEDVQEFLLRTSLLTRLNARLCDAVTGRTDSESILSWLERSGLFVRSLDLHQQWFEYHALFASILSEEQHRRSESVALQVHGIAAKWHRENGNYDEAVHHAVACRDFALAIDVLDRWSSRLVADALLVTLERWCDQIPSDMIARRPSLLIKNAWALIFLQRRDKLSPLLALLGQIPPPHDVSATTDPTIVLSMAAIARDDASSAFRMVDKVPIRERRAESSRHLNSPQQPTSRRTDNSRTTTLKGRASARRSRACRANVAELLSAKGTQWRLPA